MKPSPVLLLSLALAGCARPKPPAAAATEMDAHTISEAEAVAVVLKDIELRGGDPRGEVCSAMASDDGWRVLVQHIYYPEKKGNARFVFGGHSFYDVSSDGRILKSSGG